MLTGFDKPQRDAIVTMLLTVDREGTPVAEIFWGLWLLPLGTLVFRSGFLPRFLGVWLIINGVTYVVLSFIGIVVPQYAPTAFKLAQPALMGEIALTLWLLIAGAKEAPSSAAQVQVA